MRITVSRAVRRGGLALTAAAGLALSGLSLAPAAGAAPTAQSITTARSCATGKAPDVMACQAVKVTGGLSSLARAGGAVSPASAPSGYGPAELRSAYNLASSAGSGATVAVVVANDDPNAEADLATYRATFGLPACTSAAGCFRKVNQTGGTALPAANAGWAEEASLDLDMVSAVCPNCHLLLVEANSASMANLGTSVNTAVSLGAKYVNNSWGGGDSSLDPSYDASYFNHPGVAITVSSGDAGFGVEYPASSRYVTAVGGTVLTRASTSRRGWTESAWSGSGSGCGTYEGKPAWQHDTLCAGRTDVDVAAVAAPETGVAVFDSYGGDPGWEVFGGTSVSAPIIAGVYALAGTPSAGSYPASFPYAHPGALWDITTGSNGTCGTLLCNAGPGYDGPTGMGTPNGVTAFAG